MSLIARWHSIRRSATASLSREISHDHRCHYDRQHLRRLWVLTVVVTWRA
jgi:hypothetical protein